MTLDRARQYLDLAKRIIPERDEVTPHYKFNDAWICLIVIAGGESNQAARGDAIAVRRLFAQRRKVVLATIRSASYVDSRYWLSRRAGGGILFKVSTPAVRTDMRNLSRVWQRDENHDEFELYGVASLLTEARNNLQHGGKSLVGDSNNSDTDLQLLRHLGDLLVGICEAILRDLEPIRGPG